MSTGVVDADALLRGLCVVVSGGTPDQDAVDGVEALTAAVRRVRTKEGARKYGQPIGSIIREDSPTERKSKVKARLDKLQKPGSRPGRPVADEEPTGSSPERGTFVSGKSRVIGKINRNVRGDDADRFKPKRTMADGYLAKKGMGVRYERGNRKGVVVQTYQSNAAVRFADGSSKIISYTQMNRLPAKPGELNAPNVARKKSLKAEPGKFDSPDVIRKKLRRKKAQARLASLVSKPAPVDMSLVMLKASIVKLENDLEALTAAADVRRTKTELTRLRLELGRREAA